MSNWFSRALGGSDAKREEPCSTTSAPMAKKQETAWAVGGVILDDYLVEKELGRGGMGRVWLVKSNSTGRRFAVKQTLVKDDKHRKAFLAELQTWIDLPEHPNIVPCRFFRTVGEEIVIFADYLEGGSLADWIAKRKIISLEQILDVAIQFAWGLHAIHERGLIHQDVKPSNVLMTADGVPMVTDFGLARARLRAADGAFVSPALPQGQASFLVSSGGMTPAYASPEQRAGKPLSRKTDIWSWGVSILDMFMGDVSCPHGGHIAADVLKDFVEDGQTEGGTPEIPDAVVDVLRKCFLKDPVARWASLAAAAQSLVQAFERVTSKKYARILGQVPGGQAHAVQHDRRVGGIHWHDPLEWLREAYLAAGKEPGEADSYLPPAAFSRKGAGVAQLAIYEEAERAFEQAIASGHDEYRVRRAFLCWDKALVYMSIDDSTGAVQAHDRCISILERLVLREGQSALAQDLAGAYMHKANDIWHLGELRGAVKLHDRCISILEHMVDHEGRSDLASNLAKAFLNKASTVGDLGDWQMAVSLYDRCITIYETLIDREGNGGYANFLAGAYMNKAIALIGLGDPRKAVVLYDRCIAIREQLVEREGRTELADDLAVAFLNKANAVKSMGDLRGAVGLYDSCIATYERLVDSESRSENAEYLAGAYTSKANALRDLGDLQGAVTLHDLCVSNLERLVNREGRSELASTLAAAYMNKGAALADLGDLSRAAELFGRCVAMLERLYERESSVEITKNLAIALSNKAATFSQLGDQHGAVALYDRCIAFLVPLVERDGRNELAIYLAGAYKNKANAVRILGDLRGAVELYDRCIGIYEPVVEREGWDGMAADQALAYMNKAICVKGLGDLREASGLYDQCISILERLVERGGRGEWANYLAGAFKSKASIVADLGDLRGALKLYDRCIATRKRLFKQEESNDVDVGTAEVCLFRAYIVLCLGEISGSELDRAKVAFRILACEADRTSRSDLQGVVTWAMEVFGPQLQSGS